jgi:transposase
MPRHTARRAALPAGNAGANTSTMARMCTVDVVSGPKPGRSFFVQPRRWVIERTHGWIDHCRRLDRRDNITPEAHEGFLILSQIALLLRRLDRN